MFIPERRQGKGTHHELGLIPAFLDLGPCPLDY